jgi:N-methylhydantoinase B
MTRKDPDTQMDTQSDAATLAILIGTLDSIAGDMGENLVQSARSTLIREARDGSCALLAADGEIIAQAQHIPVQMCSLSVPLKACLERHGTIRPGEIFLTNDPFAGGQHLQDLIVFRPVFVGGELVAFAGSIAHHVDIGGGSAGMTYDAREYYQEGLRFPSCKIEVDRDLAEGGLMHDVMVANFRQSQIGLGDLKAQLAATHLGVRRFTDLIDKYGLAVIQGGIERAFEYAERLMREAIRCVPDGRYSAEDFVDGGVFDDTPIRVHVTLTVEGSTIAVDFAGSDPQVEEFLNVPYGSTVSTTMSVIKMVLDPTDEIPANAGCFRPIELRAPEGSFVNPRAPAATRARMCGAYRIFDAVLAAFQQAIPDQVPAQGYNVNTTVGFSHALAGRYAIFIEDIGGGWGGTAAHDGADMVDTPLSNCKITPVEALEREHQYLRVERYALLPDSGGAGRWRGGLGMERVFQVLKDGVTFFGYADRHLRSPTGAAGGLSGTRGSFELHADGAMEALASKCSQTVGKGERIRVLAGGGGGFGRPEHRPRGLVAADVRSGKVTAEAAAREYGLGDAPMAAAGRLARRPSG